MTISVFEITHITNDPTEHNLWTGEVRFSFDEALNEIEVANWVIIKVRIIVSETTTLEELRELLLQKAISQLSLASSASAGKAAKQLLDEARVRAEEQSSRFSWDAPNQ